MVERATHRLSSSAPALFGQDEFDLEGAKILVVDDTPENVTMLGRTLEYASYSVLAAYSGQQALEIARRELPDLILLDVSMPGMDGYETCQLLKKSPLTHDIPVIFVTARRETGSLVQGFQVGGIDYITKPIRIKEVRIRIRNHLQFRRLMKQRQALIAQLDALNRELRQKEQRTTAILENILEGVITVDRVGVIESVNPAAADVFHLDVAALVGKRLTDFFGQAYQREYQQIFALGQIDHYTRARSQSVFREIVGHRADGSCFPMEIGLCAMSTLEDTHFVVVVRDISQRKLVEEELHAHRERLEEMVRARTADLVVARDQALASSRLKSEFLANVSHELRTPLNAVIGFSAALLKGIDGPLSGEQNMSLQLILNNGKHLLHLINDVLDLSKLEAGKMDLAYQEIDLAQLIDEVIEETRTLFQGKTVELINDIAKDLYGLSGDKTRIRQIFMNLLSNAAKFTDRGAVRIGAEKLVIDDKAFVKCWVADTGCGIQVEHFKVIFEAFRQVDGSATRKHRGTGLGLSIARRFVEMHGGKIWLESQVGQGSIFYFTLQV